MASVRRGVQCPSAVLAPTFLRPPRRCLRHSTPSHASSEDGNHAVPLAVWAAFLVETWPTVYRDAGEPEAAIDATPLSDAWFEAMYGRVRRQQFLHHPRDRGPGSATGLRTRTALPGVFYAGQAGRLRETASA